MKKNLYYRTVVRRRNFLKEIILGFFFGLAALGRIYIENIIRKNMGERYFSYFLSIIVALGLVFTPIVTGGVFALFSRYGSFDYTNFFIHYTTWYIYTWFFIQYTIKRRQEIKREPSVFDFKRFSLSTGTLEEFYVPFIPKKILNDPRKCDIIGEPLPFLVVGFFLMLLGQPLGIILFISSIIYSLSYVFAYYEGDNFVMDTIDEIILNEEMENAFVNDEDLNKTRGVQFYMRKPNGEELRRKAAEGFFEDPDPKEASLAI